jgi:hypothetical protein
MAETPHRPLLNPVLRFTKDPEPKSVSGGGKNARGIKAERLPAQRRALATQFAILAAEVMRRPRFDGRVILYVAMFDDSLAPTWTPSDLFQAAREARLVAPHRTGYLVEVAANQLRGYARLVQQTDLVKDQVDISRVASVRFFADADAAGPSSLARIWEAAPETEGGRAFVVWLMPLRGREAAEHLIQTFATLRGGTIAAPPPLLNRVMAELDARVPAGMRHSLRAAAAGDRFNAAVREYRLRRRARTTVIVPTRAALQRLVASGTVFRIEPVQPISSTSPGEGREPDRPLPAGMASLPIVGIVDGGMSAASYSHAEAWRAPPFIPDGVADVKHGNRVTSLIVQGHDWNNNLTLPSLYCQVGTVQAVPRETVRTLVDPQDFIAYLDSVMAA